MLGDATSFLTLREARLLRLVWQDNIEMAAGRSRKTESACTITDSARGITDSASRLANSASTPRQNLWTPRGVRLVLCGVFRGVRRLRRGVAESSLSPVAESSLSLE